MLEEAQTVHIGHADVADNHPFEFACYVAYRFRAAQKSLDGKAGQFKRLNLRVEKILIVINQNNWRGHFGIEIHGVRHGCAFFGDYEATTKPVLFAGRKWSKKSLGHIRQYDAKNKGRDACLPSPSRGFSNTAYISVFEKYERKPKLCPDECVGFGIIASREGSDLFRQWQR